MRRRRTRWTLALLTLLWTAPAGAEWAPHGVTGNTTHTFITRTRVLGLVLGDGNQATDSLNRTSNVWLMVRFEDPVDAVCASHQDIGAIRAVNLPGTEDPDLNWVSAGDLGNAAVRARYAFLLDARNSGALVNVVITRQCTLRAVWD